VIERVAAILSGSSATQPPSGNLESSERQAGGNLAKSEHQAGNEQLNMAPEKSSPKNRPSPK